MKRFGGLLIVVLLGASAAFSQTPAGAITISGDVPKPVTITVDDIASMPHEKVSVPEPNGSSTQYEGVPLKEVLKRAGVLGNPLRGKALTTYLLAKAQDGYQIVYSLGEVDAEFGDEQILVADKKDGKPLDAKTGPLRILVPHDHAGARSVRMLQAIEVVRLQK
jgi:DMSO/TMAO reductase YedYZ molybdopterin-dependent catalytic subunit